jgi:hypothetical protein
VSHTGTYVGVFSALVVICALVIAYRLRTLAAQRADAEQRALAAFREMNRLTRELRDRHANDPAVNPSLRPGERLRLMYPGPERSRPR